MKQGASARILAIMVSFLAAAGVNAQEPAARAAPDRPVVALVLAGGSSWGLAHIGVIRVLEEAGVPVDIVVGTSIGAIVGGLYALGHDAAWLSGFARDTDWTGLLIGKPASVNETYTERTDRARYVTSIEFDSRGFTMDGGLLRGFEALRYMDTLALSCPAPISFDDLPRRFRAVATDVRSGEAVVIGSGSISEAMRASMSIPGVFTPWKADARYLVDGGVVDNLPIDVARSLGADIVIAVDLFDSSSYNPEELNRTPISSLNRSLDIFLRNNTARQLSRADLVIPVDLRGFLRSDFNRYEEIGNRGEETARRYSDGIESIARRCAEARRGASERKPAVPPIPPVSRIEIRGADDRDLAYLESLFEPVRGTVPETATLLGIYPKIDRTGRYESVRLVRDSSEPDLPLVVSFTRKPPERHRLRLAFMYGSTFSRAVTGNLDVVPSLSYRGLLTEDSNLLVDAELMDAPSIRIRFVQPVLPALSVIPFFSFSRDFTTRLTATSIGYQYQMISLASGCMLSVQPAAGLECGAGWSYEWIDSETLPAIPETGSVDSASLLRSHIGLETLDSPIFPMSGIAASCSFLLSLKQLGSERFYRVLETSGSTFLSLGTPFSIALLWKAGTDFSLGADDADTAPPTYKPDLSSRRMFPGPLSVDEQIGSHVAAAGLEIKHNLNWRSRGITLPAFLLIQAATGIVIQDPQHIDWDPGLLHWDASIGAGIRFNDAFGCALRGGVHRSLENDFKPFVAIDLGAIGY